MQHEMLKQHPHQRCHNGKFEQIQKRCEIHAHKHRFECFDKRVVNERQLHSKARLCSRRDVYTAKNIKPNGIDLSNITYVDRNVHEEIYSRCNPEYGDILYIKDGATAGVCAINNLKEQFSLLSSVALLKQTRQIDSKYLLYFLKSPYCYNDVRSHMKGAAITRITLVIIQKWLVPLPPLSEQHRIVARIEEIMPKVEQYGKAQEKLDALNAKLPGDLKNSILQEAIEGRLVPQDPKDEPAAVLIQRIREEKARLVKEKKIKKDKNESIIYRNADGHWMERFEDKKRPEVCIDEEIPFEIPEGWEWTRLRHHLSISAGLAYKKDNLAIKSDKMIRVLRGGNISYGSWSSKDDDIMISSEFVNDDLLLKRGTFISPAVTSLEQIGKTALVESDLSDIVVGGFVMMFSPYLIEPDYLKYLNDIFQTSYYKKYCQSVTNKSGQAFYNLSKAKLSECLIPLPPLSEQHRIVSQLERLLPKVARLG